MKQHQQFDNLFGQLIGVLSTPHDSIFFGPSCRETRIVAFSNGITPVAKQQTTLNAPLAEVEETLVFLFMRNGWNVRSDSSGGYIARRRASTKSQAVAA